MRVVQQFVNKRGRLIIRVYRRRMGRPKGTKNSTYRLSSKGLRVKQRIMRRLVKRLRAEGRTGWPKGVRQSWEHRLKNSIGVLRAISEGRLNPGANARAFIKAGASRKYLNSRVNHGTHGAFFSKKNCKNLRYDSAWELFRMTQLEADSDVVRYEKNPLRIPYQLDGHVHYYWPDFLIRYANGACVVEEVKPGVFCRMPRNKAKLRVARIFCKRLGMQFRLVDFGSLHVSVDAIVRPHANRKHEKPAEMTGSPRS